MKKFITVLCISAISIALWHCKKNNSPTGTDGETRRPDLIVTNMMASRTNLVPPETITLTATVSNTGARSSTATTLRWYHSTDNIITTNDTPIGTNAVSILAAGDSLTLSNTITVPNTLGTNYYGVCVDSVTDESDPNNNCSSSVRVVVVTAPPPDLIVTNMMVSRNIVVLSESITLTATVRNVGADSLTASTLRWYRSTDSTITTADTPVGMNAVSILAAGDSLTFSNTITVPNTLGTYYYGVCVDPVTNESDSNNNCSSSMKVVVAITPELIVTDMRPSRILVAPSAILTLTATVSNAAEVSPATTLRWYRSTNSTIDTTTDTEIETNAVSRLAAGANLTISNAITVTSSTGTYHYYACVDPVIGESNSSNNCSSAVAVVVSSPSAGARLGALDFTTVSGGNVAMFFGIWSDGATMWVSDQNHDKLFAYDVVTKARVSTKDFNTLSNAGNGEPTGLWSDGTTMWVTDREDDKLYAYDVVTKAHVPAKDFTNLRAAGNTEAYGLWSDGTTMWVAEPQDERLYAYSISTRTRVSAREYTNLTRANDDPYDLWSDGTTMWVVERDASGAKIYAYNKTDRTHDSAKDITLVSENDWPYGVWSDGNVMWVLDKFDSRIYAYDVRPLVTTERVVVSNPDLIVTNMMASATNADPSGPITLTATVGNTGTRMSDSTILRWYRSSDSIITTNDTEVATSSLSSLGVDGSRTISITITNNIGTYHGACVDSVTGEINTNNNCSSAINVLVTSATRVSSNDFSLAGANGAATGIFTDSTTLWVVNAGNITVEQTKIFAYSIRTRRRVSAREFNTLGSDGATRARGLWSDSTFMWVADWLDDKIYAYNMKSKARVPNRDFNTLSAAGNTQPEGIWSDRTTMWVADQEDDKIYAYNMRTKSRDSAKEFNTLSDAENRDPRGIWSDGTTMWVYDTVDNKFYAYDMESKVRVPPKEFAGSQFSTFICSDGNTMWLANHIFDKVYFYDLQESVNTALINTNR